MDRVLIGIPVRERPDLLDGTLRSLERECPEVPLVLLADGGDGGLREALVQRAAVPGRRLLAADATRGDAACFNRLVQLDASPVVVLLENGACVAPGCLQRLLQALDADPRHGLAGPSTNRAWNEQQSHPGASSDPAALAQIAEQDWAGHGPACRSLAPLHSLGDFCFAVTRRVIDAIGAADEAYGDGPCWEMDYSTRAARAGWLGVWVPSAFVWRAPVSPRRHRAEQQRFPLNKRLYQDRFCGLRLRRQTRGYDDHCTGDACEHFAPPDQVTRRIEFLPAPARPLPAAADVAALPARPRSPAPLVSCIMPTADRRPYVAAALAAFLQQDYPARELIVLDDGNDAVADLMPADERVRYLRVPRGPSLGHKRNQACALARGEIIVHWDDDDWHAHWRLSYQIGELLAHDADLCGLDRLWFYDETARRAWLYRYPGGPARWLAGGSFCYRRRLWERLRFGDVTVGEDTRFVRAATSARVLGLQRDDFYVARVHAANTCRKQTEAASWTAVPREQVEHIIECGRGGAAALPLVSCIMPTADRVPFVALALRRFDEQDHANKELVIIDDGAQPVQALVEGRADVRCVRLPARQSIGAKRNLACGLARGEFIAQWDDDDWYGPARLTHQLQPLRSGEADITGLRCRWLATLPDGAFWQITAALHRRMFVHDVHGGTLVFRKRLWDEGLRYPDASLAEDAALLREAVRRGARLRALENGGDFVYSRHGGNAWRFAAGQAVDPRQWLRSEPPPQLDEHTFATYREALTAVQALRHGAQAALAA